MHYSPTSWRRNVIALVAVLGVAGLLPGVAAARSTDTGVVYVNDNTTDTNTVAGFARQGDGHLVPLPGSPFPAGGAGTGAGLASQGAIQVSSDRRYVLAVDAGSDELSVLRIKRGGALEPVSHGIVSSGGDEPVSVTEHDGLVYVANAGAGGSNYTGFRLGGGGQPRPLAGSTVDLPAGAQPGDVLFDPTGTTVVGTRVNTSQIDSFSVRADGRLTIAPGAPFAAEGPGPFGSEFRPTDARQLFVSNAHAGPASGTVSAFSVAAGGTLSPLGGSPFADDQTAPCWVEISHDGAFLFTVNTASGSISRYAIAPGGTLTLLGSTPIGDQAGVGAVDARLSPDGRSLYVDEAGGARVGEFDVDGGQLSERGSVALPAGATPAGLAVT